jgi:anaphase-promoting complex subunit 8
LEKCESPCARFLHLYSRYLSLEKKKIDNLTELFCVPELASQLQALCTDLRAAHVRKQLDAYSLNLYGIVLKRLDLLEEAKIILVDAVNKEPLHWGAWLELASLIMDRAKVI